MLPKKWVVGISTVLMVVLLFAGYMAVAAELGSKEDPLVTLSYIEELLPELQEKIDAVIASKTAEFDTSVAAKVTEMNQAIDDKIAELDSQYIGDYGSDEFINKVADAVIAKMGDGTVASGGTSSLFEVVKFTSGQTVICEIGTEVLWRIGSATCVSPSEPGLIDITSGGTLSNGQSLQQNHVYVATIENRGFTATSDCTILIKGPYTIQ